MNLSVDVDCLAVMRLARDMGALYLDTVVEPWPGFYYNNKIPARPHQLSHAREPARAEKQTGRGPHRSFLLRRQPRHGVLAGEAGAAQHRCRSKIKVAEPNDEQGWAKLMKRVGVKGIHIAERDTQRGKKPKAFGTFLNTWSVEGFVSEGLQPAELGWGTHEKKLPPERPPPQDGLRSCDLSGAPGCRHPRAHLDAHWGAHFGFLVTHNEAISISDYLHPAGRPQGCLPPDLPLCLSPVQ